MQYRGPRRRMRRFGGFPFVLPFIILVISHGSFGAFVASFLMIMIFFLIARALMGSLFGAPMNGNYQQQQYYQPPYQPYQPYQQSYEPYQQPYQSYEQGYQPQSGATGPYQEGELGEQSYQSPAQYDQYEQPQVQYPEQMPPMQ